MQPSSQNGHERRKQFLLALASLAGFPFDLLGTLPDGARPDILLYEPLKRGLFMGDAKDTESPGNLETQVRLRKYLRWFAAHLNHPEACGVFAVCFGNRSHGNAWARTLQFLLGEVGLEYLTVQVDRFAPKLYVAWCYWHPTLRQQATSWQPQGLESSASAVDGGVFFCGSSGDAQVRGRRRRLHHGV